MMRKRFSEYIVVQKKEELIYRSNLISKDQRDVRNPDLS